MQALSINRIRYISAKHLLAGLMALAFFAPVLATAQLINVQMPLNNSRDNYYGGTGISFGGMFGGNNRIRGFNAAGQITPNIIFGQGSAGATIPPFGGYDPNAGLNTGIIYNGSNFGFGLGVSAGKGNTRSVVSRAPSVTMFNGQSGSIFSGESRPFVTGITPVVGNMTGVGLLPLQLPRDLNIPVHIEHPINDSPFTYGSPNSTATSGVLSLAEISRLKASKEQEEILQSIRDMESLIANARELVENGEFGAARIKYSRALRKLGENVGTSELRETVSNELEAIKNKR